MRSKPASAGVVHSTGLGQASKAAWGGASGMDNVPAHKRWDQGYGVRMDEHGERYVPWLTREEAQAHVDQVAGLKVAVEIVERPSGVWAVRRA